jgi:Holliday junction resolvase-like predicted endonuclease
VISSVSEAEIVDADFDLEAELEGSDEGGQEVAEIVEQLCDLDSDWEADVSVDLGEGQPWQPDAVRTGGGSLLHVHVADRLRSYATKRFALAVEVGIEVHVATTLGRLYDPDLLRELSAVDAFVHLIDESVDLADGKRLLALLADEEIQLPAALRSEVARNGLDFSAAEGTSDQKGKRFEALVAFLLSQVDGLSIFSRNYRTSTEEIDIILQQKELSGPVWAIANAPFILVEAKNHAEGVSQAMLSQFRIKMQTKRSTVRIGLLLSRTSVSADAVHQEERFSSDTLTIAFLNGDVIKAWIEAEDGTAFLERHIGEAMLG